MFVFTKKGVLSPLQSISLLAIFFTSMGVATVSPAMAKLAAQFPSNNYALISTLPTLFIVPTTLWAGAVAGKEIRYLSCRYPSVFDRRYRTFLFN